MAKFKLLQGKLHTKVNGKRVTFNKGAVIDSDVDLAAKHGRAKFEQIVEAAAPPRFSQTKLLAAMSIEQLAELAAEEELDISGCKSKEEVVQLLAK